jgi:acyl dehydratase
MNSLKVPLGTPSEIHHTYVDPDNVLAYALASNDSNPLYLDGRAVPPLFAVAVAWSAFMDFRILPPEATAGATGGVHGEHDLRILKPVLPGTWLHTVGEYSAVVCSSAGMTVFVKLVSSDDRGEAVLEQYWSPLYRGTVTGGNRGEHPGDHSFPEEARSRPVGSISLSTTRDQTFRYAGASGDRNPMHVDDEVARSFGFPRKFNQGLCTLAVASRGLIDLTAGGDPRRVRRVAVRFSSPVFPGDSLDLSVYDVGEAAGGSYSYAFEAVSDGKVALRHGLVEVAAE